MASNTKPKLETRKVGELRPREDNEKEHTEEQLDQIRESIERFGFCDPIGITPDGEVLEGNGRLIVAKEMKIEEVPVVVLPNMTEDERRAYGLAHNRIQQETGMAVDMVSQEFDRLNIVEDDHSSLGFTRDDAIFFMPDQRNIIDDEDIGSPAMDKNQWKDLIPPTFRVRLEFDDECQMERWNQFLVALRNRYLEEPTICDRVMRFIAESGEAL